MSNLELKRGIADGILAIYGSLDAWLQSVGLTPEGTPTWGAWTVTCRTAETPSKAQCRELKATAEGCRPSLRVDGVPVLDVVLPVVSASSAAGDVPADRAVVEVVDDGASTRKVVVTQKDGGGTTRSAELDSM